MKEFFFGNFIFAFIARMFSGNGLNNYFCPSFKEYFKFAFVTEGPINKVSQEIAGCFLRQ